jgi:ion channel POLLUX/CASTOR
MPDRLRNRLKFRLERWIQGGARNQLLLTAAVIAFIALLAGVLAMVLSGEFEDLGEALWWAFLRLSDPGYLGEDEGTVLRVIATVVTVMGYVLFLGSLVAILTQWLNRTISRLETGLTPISISGHVLILGWTNRTPALVHELVRSGGRMKRFLERRGARHLRIVVLAEDTGAARIAELRAELGADWNERQIILRSGSSLHNEHLARVAAGNAAVVLLPGADFAMGGAEATDTRNIKTLMALSAYPLSPGRGLPPVVAEVFDTQKLAVARQAYEGQVDLVASDSFISRLVAQNVRHRSLSFVFTELLTHSLGNGVFVRSFPEFEGRSVRGLARAFPGVVLLGIVRPEEQGFRPMLNPAASVVLAPDDRLVFMARRYEDIVPRPVPAVDAPATIPHLSPARIQPERRILFLGWSHKVTALLREFSGYTNERFEIDILSLVPAATREGKLARVLLDTERLAVRQLEGDYTAEADLRRLDLAHYHNIVLLGSDWMDSGEEADARTLLGYLLLRSVLHDDGPRPGILVELMDPENARLFRRRSGEVIISPLILSHMLAHVALRRELNSVFTDLFGPGSAEIFFRPASDYGLAGRLLRFADVQEAAGAHGEIALGIRLASGESQPGGGVLLNPLASAAWTLADTDEVVVLTTYA